MITQILDHYHTQSRIDQHHRFRSWEHCFSFFHEQRGQFKDERHIDQACLQVAFFLASWGMMRGGTFLLQKDYRIHEYLIRDTIMNSNNHVFYDAAFETSPNAYMGLNRLIREVCRSYEDHISWVNGRDESVTVSDTLASKIILGIYGCAPAYDRYFVEAMKLFGFTTRSFSEDSVVQLLEFYQENESEFESCRKKYNEVGCLYTPMKLIDMFFWQVGYLIDSKNKDNGEYQNQLSSFAVAYKSLKGVSSIKPISTHLNINAQSNSQTESIRRYIKSLLENAQDSGQQYIDLVSGDIHKDLGLKHRLPSVCQAMSTITGYRQEIIFNTPSGKSSTNKIRYYLEVL